MQSDFTAARELLECAHDKLCGSDKTSTTVRAALDTLIEAVATAEHQKPPARVIPFPNQAR
ncbi:MULTISPECIES: hypothetical protein [Phyllobacteriaceae]|uniref:hypothetical protein n=1 Tax=Phyllobacteriaceae TaxID=69277 RepID=UPI002ACA9B1A|nr:hypothetical protein [Chelativorans sp. M5D2P16]MDZ5696054.1 hypothetical protein [Chelativorans sp. M5D2P16]